MASELFLSKENNTQISNQFLFCFIYYIRTHLKHTAYDKYVIKSHVV